MVYPHLIICSGWVADTLVMRTGCYNVSPSDTLSDPECVVFFLCTQCIVFGFLAQGPLVCLNLLNSSTSTCVKPSLCAPSVNADTPEDASPEDNNRGEMTLLSLQHNPVICQQFASRRLPASSGSCMWGRCQTASGHLFQLYCWDGN